MTRLAHTHAFLRCLDLRGAEIQDRSLICLSDMPCLRMLDVSGCAGLTDFAIKCLTAKITPRGRLSLSHFRR